MLHLPFIWISMLWVGCSQLEAWNAKPRTHSFEWSIILKYMQCSLQQYMPGYNCKSIPSVRSPWVMLKGGVAFCVRGWVDYCE